MLEGLSDVDLLKHLDDISITVPDAPSLKEMREDESRMMLSPMARRELKKHSWNAGVQSFLNKFGLGEIYAYRRAKPDLDLTPWASVQTLLGNPVMRVAVDVALISGVPPDELSSLLSASCGTQLTREVLALYKKIFFDSDAMSKSDWRDYIKLCSGHAYVYVRYLTALTKPRDEALHMVGVTTKIQLGSMLNEFAATAKFKFEHYISHGNALSDEQARKWAKLGIEAGLRADKFAASDIKDFAAAVQAEFDMVDEPIDHVSGEMLAQVKTPPPADAGAPQVEDGTPYTEDQNV
jgi:hypothetical protein